MATERLGELLVREKLITADQLEKAIQEAKNSGGRLGSSLTKLGYIDEKELLGFLSNQYGIPAIDLSEFEIDPEVLSLIPQDICMKYRVIPVNRAGSSLIVAVSDPSNISAIEDIRFVTGYNIEMVVASEDAIKKAMDRHYDAGLQVAETLEDFSEDLEVMAKGQEVDVKELEKGAEDAPVVKLVNMIMTDALARGASDIHLEPYEKFFRVRYRIDGILYEMMRPPLKIKDPLVSRVKIMAKLNIAERRLPQDGRIRVKMGQKGEAVDFRVSVMPTLFGEKVVLRILSRSGLQEDMTKLGFEEKQLKDYTWAIKQPYGMVLVTGPSGCGKTTTLYSAMIELNDLTTNISTAEDPVEYNIHGINQVQMREEIGLNFASSLRSFLRQDPDIIMVGEIRDFETAEIAIKSALTGHLVLSTLHTNDAPSTITRLLNMGLEPFLVASSVLLVLSQRLVRKICEQCKESVDVPTQALISLGMTPEEAEAVTVYKGKGCGACNNLGYKGRIGIFEVMRLVRGIREGILRGESTSEIRRMAIESGMMALRQAALEKLRNGITTLEEVVRTTAVVK